MEFKVNFIFIICIIIALMLVLGIILAVRDSIKQIKQEQSKASNSPIKDFAFKLESYFAYDKDDEFFTKKDVLQIVKDIAVNDFNVNFDKEKFYE